MKSTVPVTWFNESPTFYSVAGEKEKEVKNMAISKERKNEIINKFARHEGDTGSPEVQIAVLTEEINHLNEHARTVSYTHLTLPTKA